MNAGKIAEPDSIASAARPLTSTIRVGGGPHMADQHSRPRRKGVVVPFDPSTLTEPSPIDAAWAAGVIEGEGCIRLQVSNVRDNRSGNWLLNRVTMAVSVAMKDELVVRRLHAMFGGHLYERPDGMCSLTLSSRRALWVLERVAPFMVGDKKPQAELAIEFQRGRVSRKRTESQHLWQLEAALRISEMKRVGLYRRRKGPPSKIGDRIRALVAGVTRDSTH